MREKSQIKKVEPEWIKKTFLNLWPARIWRAHGVVKPLNNSLSNKCHCVWFHLPTVCYSTKITYGNTILDKSCFFSCILISKYLPIQTTFAKDNNSSIKNYILSKFFLNPLSLSIHTRKTNSVRNWINKFRKKYSSTSICLFLKRLSLCIKYLLACVTYKFFRLFNC